MDKLKNMTRQDLREIVLGAMYEVLGEDNDDEDLSYEEFIVKKVSKKLERVNVSINNHIDNLRRDINYKLDGIDMKLDRIMKKMNNADYDFSIPDPEYKKVEAVSVKVKKDEEVEII